MTFEDGLDVLVFQSVLPETFLCMFLCVYTFDVVSRYVPRGRTCLFNLTKYYRLPRSCTSLLLVSVIVPVPHSCHLPLADFQILGPWMCVILTHLI